MNKEIDWDSVFASLPEIMGLPKLRLHGRAWYGPYRIDGSGHHRFDKLAIKQGKRDKHPVVLEQGGESMTLWSWLVDYGHLSNSEVAHVLTGTEKKELKFDEDEYSGPTKFVEFWRFVQQGGSDKRWHCPLFSYLSRIYGSTKVSNAFLKYHVSTGLKHPRTGVVGTRFWYFDSARNILHDKTMFYGPDGHRLKDCPPMRMFKKRMGYRGVCFFGEDSMVPGRTVFIVESEKTAIIAHLEYPKFNWIASGGLNNLRQRGLPEGYKVYLVPDVDGAEEWSKYGKVWRWWETCGMKVGEKWDIGDYIIQKNCSFATK